MLEDLARRTGAAIVFPDYTRAPHQIFPFPFEQSYEVLDYIVRHGNEFKLSVETIALAGDSVGGTLFLFTTILALNRVLLGHMAIAMMQMSLERKLPTKIGQLVLWALVTVTHKEYPSYKTYGDAPFLPAMTMQWMIDTFMPNKVDRETALASPLAFLPDEVLSRFPPTTIFLSTVDPLVDEGVAFGHRLQALGVDAAVIKAEGQLHGFCLVKDLREGPAAKAVLDLAALRLCRIFPNK